MTYRTNDLHWPWVWLPDGSARKPAGVAGALDRGNLYEAFVYWTGDGRIVAHYAPREIVAAVIGGAA